MRRILVLVAALALVPAAGAGTHKPKTGFEFGRSGGNIMPFSIAVAVSGAVTATGAAPDHRKTLTKQQLANLNRVTFVVAFETMPAVTACPQTLPDIAAQYIRVGNRTVRVHGSCLKGFNRLWTALAHATRSG